MTIDTEYLIVTLPQGNLFVKAVNETYGFLVFKIGNKDIELKEAVVDMSTYN